MESNQRCCVYQGEVLASGGCVGIVEERTFMLVWLMKWD